MLIKIKINAYAQRTKIRITKQNKTKQEHTIDITKVKETTSR